MFAKNRFKAAIALRGKTTADVADMLGISRVTLYRKLNGESDFLRREIEEIRDYLKIDNLEDIFFAKDDSIGKLPDAK